jgi:hypothetical protein
MSNTINLWDTLGTGINYHETQLKNTIHTCAGGDNAECWLQNTKNNIKTYTKEDFDYRFNSLGFRSSEFNNNAPVKILYVGCSVTEGTGLPEEHIWASFLNSQISKEIGKPVNLYNGSRGGHAIDAIIRYSYLIIKNNFKPDFVFFMLPGVTRKEIILESSHVNQMATYNFIPYSKPATNSLPTAQETYKNLVNIINYRDSYNSCFKNLLFIKYFLMSEQINWAFAFWGDDLRPDMISTAVGVNNNLDTSIPSELTEHYVPGGMVFDTFYDKNPQYSHQSHRGIFEKISPYTIARDGKHFGPNSHYNFSKDIYKYISEKPYFQELLDKWKK